MLYEVITGKGAGKSENSPSGRGPGRELRTGAYIYLFKGGGVDAVLLELVPEVLGRNAQLGRGFGLGAPTLAQRPRNNFV